jgi:hypothetical protein
MSPRWKDRSRRDCARCQPFQTLSRYAPVFRAFNRPAWQGLPAFQTVVPEETVGIEATCQQRRKRIADQLLCTKSVYLVQTLSRRADRHYPRRRANPSRLTSPIRIAARAVKACRNHSLGTIRRSVFCTVRAGTHKRCAGAQQCGVADLAGVRCVIRNVGRLKRLDKFSKVLRPPIHRVADGIGGIALDGTFRPSCHVFLGSLR